MKLKISRLFHWLYATLMFLPLLMFIPSCLYYGFNEHATNETTTQINYKYQSNEVNTLDDLVNGNIYFLDEFTIEDDISLNILSVSGIDNLPFNFTINDIYLDEGGFFIIEKNDNELLFTVGYANTSIDLLDESYNNDIVLYNFVFVYNSNTQYLIFDNRSYLPQYTDYNVIESVETNVQDTISNKMYLAWEGVWNLPLFQWTKNSFITAPFSYITGLFGLGSDNSLNCVFTYFASISICWLVFDLIMYVPNLAHRWLDRSAIE